MASSRACRCRIDAPRPRPAAPRLICLAALPCPPATRSIPPRHSAHLLTPPAGRRSTPACFRAIGRSNWRWAAARGCFSTAASVARARQPNFLGHRTRGRLRAAAAAGKLAAAAAPPTPGSSMATPPTARPRDAARRLAWRRSTSTFPIRGGRPAIASGACSLRDVPRNTPAACSSDGRPSCTCWTDVEEYFVEALDCSASHRAALHRAGRRSEPARPVSTTHRSRAARGSPQLRRRPASRRRAAASSRPGASSPAGGARQESSRCRDFP